MDCHFCLRLSRIVRGHVTTSSRVYIGSSSWGWEREQQRAESESRSRVSQSWTVNDQSQRHSLLESLAPLILYVTVYIHVYAVWLQ